MITNNLVLIGQIIKEGMPIWFNHVIASSRTILAPTYRSCKKRRYHGYAQRNRGEHNNVNGFKDKSNIELWHKRLGHINLDIL